MELTASLKRKTQPIERRSNTKYKFFSCDFVFRDCVLNYFADYFATVISRVVEL